MTQDIIDKLQNFQATVSIVPVKPDPNTMPILSLSIEGQHIDDFDTYGEATSHLQMLIENGLD